MTHGRKSASEILEELLDNPEPERPLRGHEILFMLRPGNIEPGNYEVEMVRPDGTVEAEAFHVDDEGAVTDLETTLRPDGRSRKGKEKSREPRIRRSE